MLLFLAMAGQRSSFLNAINITILMSSKGRKRCTLCSVAIVQGKERLVCHITISHESTGVLTCSYSNVVYSVLIFGHGT